MMMWQLSADALADSIAINREDRAVSIYYVNGDFVDSETAMLPVRDLSVLRGYGAFDYLRTYNGKPFRLMNNIHRLRRSADLIDLHLPWTDDDLYEIVMATLARNTGSDDYNIRIVVTGGISPDNILPQDNPSLLVLINPLKPNPAHWYSDGVKVITVDLARLIPGAKSINYIPAIMALRQAREQDAIEALYRTPQQTVLEGTTTNVFIVSGGQLITPVVSILPGLTRGVVLELANPIYTVQERDLTYTELVTADEVFITASNKRIVPVRQVDDHSINTGTPGPVTQHIMRLFDDITIHAGENIPG